MAAPDSASKICNLALDHILQTNEEAVTDITAPTSETEKICARWYDQTRREVLRRKPWNFALKRVALTATTDTPAFGYDRAFNLPNDFIRVVSLEDPSLSMPEFPMSYQLEGNQILTNMEADTNLNLRYIYDFTSVAKMDSLFINLLVVTLAKNMAYKFSASTSDVQRLDSLMREAMAAAGAIDGQERPPIKLERSGARTRRRTHGGNQRTSATLL